jgi:hypothetical protein
MEEHGASCDLFDGPPMLTATTAAQAGVAQELLHGAGADRRIGELFIISERYSRPVGDCSPSFSTKTHFEQ